MRFSDQRSDEARAYRHLYAQARWKGPHGRRRDQLTREPLCKMCLRAGQITNASHADHVIPHRGDPTLFWQGELQSLCPSHHNSTKQAQEHRGYSSEIGADGMPLDPNHPFNAT